jgi:hypothetical protein
MSIESRRHMATNFISSISGGGVIDRGIFADGWTCWNASLGEISGDTYLKAIGYTQQVLPELKMSIDQTVAEENRVVVQAVSQAPLPDGTVYANRYVFVFTFAGEKVTHIAAYFDTQTANTLLLPLVKARQSAAEAQARNLAR